MPEKRRVYASHKKSLEGALAVRILKELALRLPPEETEAAEYVQREIARLTAELHRLWDIA